LTGPEKNMRAVVILGLSGAFLSLVSGTPQTGGRDAAWRQDINVARTEFLAKDRSFSAAARDRAEAVLGHLYDRVDRLSDAQIEAGLARAAALSGNAHTRAYLLRNRGVWRRFPIRIWRFADSWRVVAARPEHAGLLGARLVGVAGFPVEKAARKVRPLFAGNDNWARYMATYSLTSPDALIGSDMLTGDGAAGFEFEQDGRRVRVELGPEPFARRETPEESWWFLSPAHPATKGWRHVLEGQALPPALAGAGRSYGFDRGEGQVAYLQFNRAQDDPAGESVAEFSDRVMAGLAARPARRLIVDLRFNTGGDLTKGWRLFETLGHSPLGREPGGILVIVGPNTFSAAISHLVQLRQGSKAMVVGTEPGDVLETWSEGGNVRLPNSGINMHYADRAHTYSLKARRLPPDLVALDLNVRSLRPDRRAEWTWAAYAAGRDPYMEKALGRPLRLDASPKGLSPGRTR
jgi:hypothetical protein